MNDYAPQMIVKTPSPWHVLATQNSTAQTPGLHVGPGISRYHTICLGSLILDANPS